MIQVSSLFHQILSIIAPYTHWADALWIPIAALAAHKSQKIKAVLFVLACMFALRLQADIFARSGYPTGFISLMESYVLYRGMIIYSVFIALYLILSYYSPYTRGVIYMAASLSIFFMAFFVSILMMTL